MPLLAEFKQPMRLLKAETFALCLAACHPGTTLHAKRFVAGIVAYAFGPLDLIPDFIMISTDTALAVKWFRHRF
jgi:uncharacterized membrane protein YkvA (DUF1232 family)